jgi:hypothetical protein
LIHRHYGSIFMHKGEKSTCIQRKLPAQVTGENGVTRA